MDWPNRLRGFLYLHKIERLGELLFYREIDTANLLIIFL
jgi:hypothetical protein